MSQCNDIQVCTAYMFQFIFACPNKLILPLKAFVDAESSEDFGYSSYSVEDVHRVGILDLRIASRPNKKVKQLCKQQEGRASTATNNELKCSCSHRVLE